MSTLPVPFILTAGRDGSRSYGTGKKGDSNIVSTSAN